MSKLDTFQFSAPGKEKHGSYHELTGHVYNLKDKPEPPPPASWQGKPIGSVQEWRYILALEHYKLNYEYQLSVAGGRTRRGGQVLDFMVYTQPIWTPVSIVGAYWHSGENAQDDELRIYSLMREFKGMIRRPVKIMDYELPDFDTALILVRRDMITG